MSSPDASPPNDLPRLNVYRPVLEVVHGFESLQKISGQVASFAHSRSLGPVTLVEPSVVSVVHNRVPSQEELLSRFGGNLDVALAKIREASSKYFPKSTEKLGPVALTGVVVFPSKEQNDSLVILTTGHPDVLDEQARVKDLFGIAKPGLLARMALCRVEQRLGKGDRSALVERVEKLIPPDGIGLEVGQLVLEAVPPRSTEQPG